MNSTEMPARWLEDGAISSESATSVCQRSKHCDSAETPLQ